MDWKWHTAELKYESISREANILLSKVKAASDVYIGIVARIIKDIPQPHFLFIFLIQKA